jgi:formate dehydrogenase subunit delta
MTQEQPHGAEDSLVRMANQIAVAFRMEPHEEAVAATTEHINLYWTRKMRADIIAYLKAGGAGLNAMASDAVRALRQPAP